MYSKEKRLIAFALYPGATPLDLIGPLTVLRNQGIRWPFQTVVVGKSTEPTKTDTPLRIIPTHTFQETPAPFALFVPGGGTSTIQAMRDESLLAYIRSAQKTAEIVGSIGNGALVLAAASLLKGQEAAIHWDYGAHLERLGTKPAQERWVEEGGFLTAAGGSAGIDMMLHLVAKYTSESTARFAQLATEYDPQPPFGGEEMTCADRELTRDALHFASSLKPDDEKEEPMRPPAVNQEEKTIAILLYAGMTALDAVGPLQVLSTLERFAPNYRTVLVGQSAEPMDTDVHVQMIPDKTFDEVPHPFAIVVPGGRTATLRAMSDPAIREYVRSAAESADIVASVCTGSLILAAVGLLEGRRATTNWFFSKTLEHLGAKYVQERWVEEGKLLMSAGVSAGIDMALYLAARLSDEATARRVQLALDYEPQPPFGGIDWEHLPILPRLIRSGFGLAAPAFTAKPRRLTRSARTAPEGTRWRGESGLSGKSERF